MTTKCIYPQSTCYRQELEVRKNLMDWLKQIVLENNCKVEQELWKSEYNSYVVYDYQPFCSDGFLVFFVITSNCYQNIEFINYLYKKKLKTLNYLQDCLHR